MTEKTIKRITVLHKVPQTNTFHFCSASPWLSTHQLPPQL
jgi:hypothetical protein